MSEEKAFAIGTWHFDAINQRMIVDQNTLRLFGREDYDGSIETFFSYLHEQDREAVEQAVRNTLEHGTHYKVTYRVVLPDGSDRKIEASGAPVRDEQGTVVEVSGICEVVV